MERAEEKAKIHAKAIADLKSVYDAGHYSECGYYEKLNELIKGHQDAIKAAKEEKDAIVELNEQRVDAIKEGIEKQIDAYRKLIEVEKEELETKKDTYDFNKSTMDQQKSIIDIQRKIASVSAAAAQGDLASIAKKKQLEAELIKAQEELQESYHDRSVDNQQDALDKELENFETEKEKEIEQWDKYLEDIEAVVAESLGIVKANAEEIGATLTEKTTEYGVTVSDAVLNPWRDGSVAIDEYTTKFGDSVSSTTEQLETIRLKWQEINEEIADANKEADIYYNKDAATADGPSVSDIHAENKAYYDAKPIEDSVETPVQPPNPDEEYSTYTVKKGDNLWAIARNMLGSENRWNEIYNLNKDIISNPSLIYPGQKLKLPKHAKGLVSAKEDHLALIDELGEELQIVPDGKGRLAYIRKGTGILTSTMTERLMYLAMNPQEMLDRNRPTITPSKRIVNTEINLDCSVGTLVNIEHCEQSTLPDVEKIVNNALEKHTQRLNQSLRKFAR
jgi:LysM repeat protein